VPLPNRSGAPFAFVAPSPRVGLPQEKKLERTAMGQYDATFFDYVNSGAVLSANKLLPLILDQIPITSVLDVGCGQGAWLSVWNRLGVTEFLGVDGDYVNREHLLVPESNFRPADLVRGFEVGRRFDLAQSLEVGEHLPADAAAHFVKCMVQHADMILFSAAPKGQGGDHHINERPYDYWREFFAENGYAVFDFIRPAIINDPQIEPWYRYNTFFYASEERARALPKTIRGYRVPDGTSLKDLSPWHYQIRKSLVSILPIPIATGLAKYKERYISRKRRALSQGPSRGE
jgi:SAM-dependent methyltransferase